MKEKIITGKKHGMAVLLLTILLYIGAFVLIAFNAEASDAGDAKATACIIAAVVWITLGWILLIGLKVL